MPRKNRVSREERQSVALVAEPGTQRVIKVSVAPDVVPETAVHIVETSTVSAEPAPPDDPPSPDPAPPLPSPPQKANQSFQSFELIWEVCKDALSTTWAAKRDGIERPLALRIFNARVTDSAQVRSIQKAANKAKELTHVNHVTVYETGVGDNGAPYVVTDWVEGDTLAETFTVTKRLDIATFLNIFNQICEALSEAHSHQLIHGNLSPNKIILVHQDDVDAELVKLIDFGMPPDPVQNAFYLSPEQCLDRNKADQRSDIYSLGCIMYEALVGSPPFIGDKIAQASTNYLHELANQYGKGTPEHNALRLLDCIIIKCLQKKPNERFRNTRELMDALRLVSDCIVNGNTRKLPPKAEKLLLFRFIDFFEKKIVVCMCTYLLLGLISFKYLGELQLQKYIDAAQLACGVNFPQATSNWKEALHVAQLSNKPPSLQADLHWELAESLKRQMEDAKNPESRNAIGREALAHYEEALKYFSHGSNYKSYELALLQNMSYLWMSHVDLDAMYKVQNAALQEVKGLFEKKKYKQCAQAAKEYMLKFKDPEIAFYGGCANNEIGTSLPPKEGLPYFQRAEYYFGESGMLNPLLSNRNICVHSLGYDATAPDTYLGFGCKALGEGDLDAASGEFLRATVTSYNNDFGVAIEVLRDLRRMMYYRSCTLTDTKNAIEPLERTLKIQEKANGMNDLSLSSTLLSLAECYSKDGQAQKAIDAYKRAFSIIPQDQQNDMDVLAYVDLLESNGKRAQARELLERIVQPDKGNNGYQALYIRLLQLYSADKDVKKAERAIKLVLNVPDPVKLIIYEEYYGHSLPHKPSKPDYDRSGPIIKAGAIDGDKGIEDGTGARVGIKSDKGAQAARTEVGETTVGDTF